MSIAFARGLKDCRVQVGDLVMEVSEKSIIKATGLPTEAEHWSKNMIVTIEQWHKLLNPYYQNVNWSARVPRNYIKDEWQKVLIVIEKFIIGERRYVITFQYHI